ncbi:MAG: baseplate J/gp47 family protein [Burkholderiales bacterium]|nr:baseplate J/gp47 family protein [Burkholderiales bacterium]
MPYTRQSLNDLVSGTATQIESRLPGILARLRRNLAAIVARMVGGAIWSLQGYAETLDRNKWPDLCDPEWLDWHGARWGVTRKAAQRSTGTNRFTGVNGTVIPAGTVVQRVDAVQYETLAGAVVAGGEALVAIRALVAGSAGNSLVGTALTLAVPIGGLNSASATTTALALGSNLEDHEPYRARILKRIRQPPMGGAAHDYEQWALEVPGVTRVWTYPLENGDGSMTVRFVRDGDVSFIPDGAEVTQVFDYVDARRPVTVDDFRVLAPAGQAVPFTLHISPDTAEVRAAVLEELDAIFASTDNEPGGTILLTHLREAVSTAVGENDHIMTLPAANIVLPANTMATRGAVTWT